MTLSLIMRGGAEIIITLSQYDIDTINDSIQADDWYFPIWNMGNFFTEDFIPTVIQIFLVMIMIQEAEQQNRITLKIIIENAF